MTTRGKRPWGHGPSPAPASFPVQAAAAPKGQVWWTRQVSRCWGHLGRGSCVQAQGPAHGEAAQVNPEVSGSAGHRCLYYTGTRLSAHPRPHWTSWVHVHLWSVGEQDSGSVSACLSQAAMKTARDRTA